ncbi:hypothetical protein Nmel_015020 [Mimus melanotis]
MLPSPCDCCSQGGEGWAAEGNVPTQPPASHPGTAQLLTPSLPPSKPHPGLGILTKGSVAVQSEMGESRAAVPGSRGGGSRVVGTGADGDGGDCTRAGGHPGCYPGLDSIGTHGYPGTDSTEASGHPEADGTGIAPRAAGTTETWHHLLRE